MTAPKHDDQQNAPQSNVPKDCDCADARRYRWLRDEAWDSNGSLIWDNDSSKLDAAIDAALASEARDSTLRDQTDAASGRDDGSRDQLLGNLAVAIMQDDRQYLIDWAKSVKVTFPDGAPCVKAASKQ